MASDFSCGLNVKCAHWVVCLKTWSSAGNIVWEGFEFFGGITKGSL